MKIRLDIDEEHYEQAERMLRLAGFTIDEDAEFVLIQKSRTAAYITAKNETGERLRVSTEEIVFIESFGHDVVIHTPAGETLHAFERLYQLSAMLDPDKFLRVSNCAIIAKSHVRKIKPSLSMKFILTMSDGSLVDVTRSYYSAFREFFRI